MLTHFFVALAATLQTCQDVNDAYKTQCCGKEPLSHATFDAECASGFAANTAECGEPLPLGDLHGLDNLSLPLKTMRASYRVLLGREPQTAEVLEAFTKNADGSLTSKLSYNQIENKILRDNGVVHHLLGRASLKDEVYVVVGGSGGLGFSAAVSLAMYTDIEKVYIVGGRSAAPFEAQKKVAMTNGECQKGAVAYSRWDGQEDYPSDVRNRSSASVRSILRRRVGDDVVQLRRQECDPMYYGPLNVPSWAFDKIEFIATDVRVVEQVESAVSKIDKLPIGIFYAQIGGGLFSDIPTSEERAYTLELVNASRVIGYQPNTAYPSPGEFNANVALGVERLIELTPDRQTSMVETSGYYDSMGLSTYKLGTGNVKNAFLKKFGVVNTQNKTVFTIGASTTSLGAKLNSKYPVPAFSEYLAMKAINLRRIQSWGASGGKSSAVFADGIRTQAFMGFMEAPGPDGIPTWFRLLISNQHDFNKKTPFMLASQNLISTGESPGVYSTFTNADYDNMFTAIQYIDAGFNAPDSAVFLTPHAYSLMYLHSFLRSLESPPESQPVLLNALQFLALDLSDTTEELVDPAVRGTFSQVTQFDCPQKREALAKLQLLDDLTFGFTPFVDWNK